MQVGMLWYADAGWLGQRLRRSTDRRIDAHFSRLSLSVPATFKSKLPNELPVSIVCDKTNKSKSTMFTIGLC
jgi:hypothetical protein